MLHSYNKFIGIVLLLSILWGCSTLPELTYRNFVKVEKGMTEQEVINILGEPTEVTSVSLDPGMIGNVFGIKELAGTHMIWKTNQAKANVILVGGKVRSSNFTNQF